LVHEAPESSPGSYKDCSGQVNSPMVGVSVWSMEELREDLGGVVRSRAVTGARKMEARHPGPAGQ
jgi:hypothetical protein